MGSGFSSLFDIFNPAKIIDGILSPFKQMIGLFKDLGFILSASSGVFVFFTTYHRRAIYSGVRSGVQFGAQAARQYGPLLLA